MSPTIIIAALLLTGITAPVFGQVAQLPNTTIPTQCIDLNQDRICEAVVLANGTMINFTKPTSVQTPEKKTVLPERCEGLTISRCPPSSTPQTTEKTTLIDNCTMPDPKTQCFTEVLDNGTLLVTNGTPEPVEVTTTGQRIDFSNVPITETPYGETYGETYEEEADEFVIAEEDEAVERSSDGGNDDNGGDRPNPYCDKFEGIDDWPDSGCHDRRDYYDGGPKDGLYPCNDGTDKKDWRDCKDASGYDYDDGNDDSNDEEDTGGSNPEGEEEDQSCGGEPCTDDEKEDSWTDEDEEGVPLG